MILRDLTENFLGLQKTFPYILSFASSTPYPFLSLTCAHIAKLNLKLLVRPRPFISHVFYCPILLYVIFELQYHTCLYSFFMYTPHANCWGEMVSVV